MRLAAAVVGCALVLATLAVAQDTVFAPATETLAVLEADAREGERDLLAQARLAVAEAERRRSLGDEAGAERAEGLAEAAIELVQVRRLRDAAALRLEETRARRRALDERVREATEAARNAALERDRLAGTGSEP
jgi:hypothetical protein